jgi:hypothetical protein
MTPRHVMMAVVTVLTLASAAVVALFVVQNSERSTQLTLNLGFAAWQLAQPVSVPALIGVAFAAGFVLAAVPLGAMAISASRRARRLGQEAALNGDRSPWR